MLMLPSSVSAGVGARARRQATAQGLDVLSCVPLRRPCRLCATPACVLGTGRAQGYMTKVANGELASGVAQGPSWIDLPQGLELAGRYRIGRVLARGGMGVVYEAEHLALKREVALKTLRPDLLHDREAVARFVREARAAASIGHSGTVQVFDLATDRGITFLSMERLRGEELSARMARLGALPIKSAVTIGAELAEAMGAAHARGVVHRDLTPRNVFLARDAAGREVVKVLDFGIAKLIESRLRSSTTQPQQVQGTLAYMSPERIAGESAADPRIDVYAIGAILYEALSGLPPFSATSYPQLAMKISFEPLVPLRTRRPDVPLILASLVDRALHRDPDQRWSNARQLATALLELQEQRHAPDPACIDKAGTTPELATGFSKADWNAPLELEKRLQAIPSHATVRGLFFRDLMAQFPQVRAHLIRDRYLPFGSYPFTEWVQVLTTTARVCFPECPPREGIRRIGRRAFPALNESQAGRVLFALAGHGVLATISASSKAFALAQSVGSCEVISLKPGMALLRIRDGWDYPDAYYVGVYEGIFEVFALTGEVDVRVHSLCDCDLRLSWTEPATVPR